MKILKTIVLSLLTGANSVTIALMLAVGYSDHINPADYPLLGCLGMFFPLFIAANMAFLVLWLIVKWKRVWIPIAGFALAYMPIRTYIPLNPSAKPPSEDYLKVISYNVAGFNYNKNKTAFDSIYAYLERQQPDIVCLQEDVNPKIEIIEHMGQLFPYNDTIHVGEPTQKYINAVGLHTRFPIVKSERISYGSTNNGSAAFYVLIDGDTTLIINNHLESTHMSEGDRQRYTDVLKGDVERDSMRQETSFLLHKVGAQMALRAPQAEAVHQYIEEHRHYPIIVCGDFNDTPISYTHYTIGKGLADCFVESGTGIGLSYNQKGFFFRIDHIMCSDHFTPQACKIDSKIDISDHYPVVCWLKKVDKP